MNTPTKPTYIQLAQTALSYSRKARRETNPEAKAFCEGAAHAFIFAARKIRDEQP